MHSGNPEDTAFHLDYMSITYEKNGRTRGGADCWGATRIILEEQKGWRLPELPLIFDDTLRGKCEIAESVSSNSEWRRLEPGTVPQLFDVIQYVVCGFLHVGVMLNDRDYLTMSLEGMVPSSIVRDAFNRVDLRIYRHVEP